MSTEAPRIVSFQAEGFTAFLNVLSSTYGSAGDAMIYDMSEKYGINRIQKYLPNLPEGLEARISELRLLSKGWERQGWGGMTIEEVDVEGGDPKCAPR